MISGTLVKILSIVLLMVVAVVLILGLGPLFKGGEIRKNYSIKLMHTKLFFNFIALIVLFCFVIIVYVSRFRNT